MNISNNIPRILMITSGNHKHSSSRIRAIQYIPFLEPVYKVKWLPRSGNIRKTGIIGSVSLALLKRLNLLKIYYNLLLLDYDILFIQRVLFSAFWLNLVRKRGKKIIFDFDDAIHLSKKRNAGNRTNNSIRLADCVITSCPVLFEFARRSNTNTIVIPSAVDTDAIVPSFKEESFAVTIGWIGSSWTTKYLNLLSAVFERLSARYNIKLLLVGASSRDAHFKTETEFVAWSVDTEDLYLQSMDIGIMPLYDGEFEQAKGGYKLFQYMAAGKPVLASPVGINSEIVENGENGFLCKDEKDWLNHLSYLIEHREARVKLGQKGREIAVSKYGLKHCAKKLIEVLEDIHDK